MVHSSKNVTTTFAAGITALNVLGGAWTGLWMTKTTEKPTELTSTVFVDFFQGLPLDTWLFALPIGLVAWLVTGKALELSWNRIAPAYTTACRR